MGVYFLFIICGILFGLGFWRKAGELEQRKLPVAPDWAVAASTLGLTYEPDRISGRLQGFEILVLTNTDDRRTSITVGGEGQIDADLTLHVGSKLTGTWKKLAGEEFDVETGDLAFDEHIFVRGSIPRVLAVLNAATRRAIQQLVEIGNVNNARISIQQPHIVSANEVVRLVRLGVDVATKLSLPLDATARALADNALRDPELGVQAQNRECLCALLCSPSRKKHHAALAGRHPLSEDTARAARAALAEIDPQQHLLGAMLTGGKQGFAVLQGLARQESVPTETRQRALLTLATQHPWEDVCPIVTELLVPASPEGVQVSAIAAVGEARERKLTGNVCALVGGASEKVACEIGRTLELLEDGSSEAALLALLEHEADAARLSAAKALRHAGTIRAVEPLLNVEKGRGSDALKLAVRAAIGGIQGRLGAVEAGRLSLVDPDDRAGALSLAREAGGLSLVNPADRSSKS